MVTYTEEGPTNSLNVLADTNDTLIFEVVSHDDRSHLSVSLYRESVAALVGQLTEWLRATTDDETADDTAFRLGYVIKMMRSELIRMADATADTKARQRVRVLTEWAAEEMRMEAIDADASLRATAAAEGSK